MAVNGPLTHVSIVRVSLFHELGTGFDVSGASRQRMKNEKLGNGQGNDLAVPDQLITIEIQLKRSCLNQVLIGR